MNSSQFKIFAGFRDDFRAYCSELSSKFGAVLVPLQKSASQKDTPSYPLENPVVYNTALDEITEKSEIRLIVIGDNPGKDEQLSKNQKYLVGQSGKIAAGFFRNHPEFKIDFRQNAIILNKTPVHTAKTKHLKYLNENGGSEIRKLIEESQGYMAEKTAELHKNLCRAAENESEKPDIFLVGYGELKKNGIFALYNHELKKSYENAKEEWSRVFVFQHFSMNRFSIDLKNYMEKNPGLEISEAARRLGEMHKKEIFV